MKCRYAYCKLGGEVERDIAVKIGSAYYHKECNKEREYKQLIEKTYYEVFKNKEPIVQVRKGINKYVHTDNYECEYILFVLNEDIVLNSIFGLIYYLNNKKFSDKYNRQRAKLIEFDADKVEKVESKKIEYNKQKKKGGWGDIICK